MIAALSGMAAVVLVAAAAWRKVRAATTAPPVVDPRQEPDWDDWPSDGRAP